MRQEPHTSQQDSDIARLVTNLDLLPAVAGRIHPRSTMQHRRATYMSSHAALPTASSGQNSSCDLKLGCVELGCLETVLSVACDFTDIDQQV
jgi:hypothetical protein